MTAASGSGETRALLSLRGVTVRFGGLLALRSVDLDVARGEIRGLIGPNGAGKTTLLNVIAGRFRPTAGAVMFDGRTVTGRGAHHMAALGIGRTFQHLALFAGMTVVENVMVGLHGPLTGTVAGAIGGRREAWAHQAARKLLQRFGLEAAANQTIASLSVADRKRVELIRALAAEPRMLLLDEPAAGLSGAEVRALIELLRSLRDAEGLTIVLVEHIMELVMEACDHVTVLNFGQVLAEGSPKEVRADARVVDAYLGGLTV